MILSVGMMMKYSLSRPELGTQIDRAVKAVIEAGIITKDIGGSSGTKEVGDAIALELEKSFKTSTA